MTEVGVGSFDKIDEQLKSALAGQNIPDMARWVIEKIVEEIKSSGAVNNLNLSFQYQYGLFSLYSNKNAYSADMWIDWGGDELGVVVTTIFDNGSSEHGIYPVEWSPRRLMEKFNEQI